MSVFRSLKNRFNLGEFGKRAFGLANLEEYSQGAAEVTNMIPMSTGGVRRRDGSRYLLSAAAFIQFYEGANNGVALASASFSGYNKVIGVKASTGDYVLVLKPNDAGSVEAAFHARLLSWGNTGYSIATISSVTVNSETTGTTQVIRGFGNDGPQAPDLLKMKHVQVGDVLYTVANRSVPSWFAFNSTTAMNVGNIYSLPSTAFTTALQLRVPYESNTTVITLDPDNTDGLTAGSLNTVVASASLFDSGMIGQTIFRLHSGSMIVESINSATSAECRIIETLSASTATATWEESSWSDYRGWPTDIASFEGRLYYFRGDTFWASQSGDVTQMSENVGTTITASSPFSYSLDIGSAEEICWVESGNSLVFGTTEAEYSVVGPDSNESISATNFGVKKQTENGSYLGAASTRIDNALYFVDRSGDAVREYVFDDRENAFKTNNVAKLNFGMFRKTIEYRQSDTAYDFADGLYGLSNAFQLRDQVRIYDMERQVDQDNIVWMIDNYGALTSLTIDRQSGTYGFAYHKLGGSLDNNDTVKVHSISVVSDRLLLMVERTINETDITYLEVIPKQFLSDEIEPTYVAGVGFSENIPIYTDATGIDSNNNNDITDHDNLILEGETVSILADGRYVGTGVVASNTVTITRGSKIITAGLAYESLVKLLPTEAGSQLGTAHGAKKRVTEASIRFNRTVAATVGIDVGTTQFDDISFRTPDMLLSAAIPLFSGIKDVQIPYHEEEQQLVIKTSKPLPMEISAITLKGTTNE